MAILHTSQPHEPWNKGKLIGQKAPLKLKDVWAIRIRLQLGHKVRHLALFNLAIDSKLRACDLVKLRVSDVSHGVRMASRSPWSCNRRPVALSSSRSLNRLATPCRLGSLMPTSRPRISFSPADCRTRPHLSTRQYARIVHRWVEEAGLESGSYGTHTMHRIKASLIYRRTRSLRAIQLLLPQHEVLTGNSLFLNKSDVGFRHWLSLSQAKGLLNGHRRHKSKLASSQTQTIKDDSDDASSH